MPIGFKPTKDKIYLSWKGDLLQEYEPVSEGTYPEGTTARIEVYADDTGDVILKTWNGVLNPERTMIQFFVQHADTDDVPDDSPYHMYQSYPYGVEDADFLRYFGRVSRQEEVNGTLD